MKILASLVFLLLSSLAVACGGTVGGPVRVSEFRDHDHFSRFMNENLKCVAIQDFMIAIFGTAQFKPAELQLAERTLKAIFPNELVNMSEVRTETFGDGFRREIRAYWNPDELQYLWAYFLSHQQPDGPYRVFELYVNSNPKEVFERFR